jgi:AraC-like DNA-binding protein
MKVQPNNLISALSALFKADQRSSIEKAKSPFVMQHHYKDLMPNQFGRVVLISSVRSWGPTPTAKAKIITGINSLVYVLEGSGHFSRSDGFKCKVKAGDMFFTFPEFRHSFGGGLKTWSEFSVWFEGPIFKALLSAGMLDKSAPVLHLEPIEYWVSKLQALIPQDKQASRESVFQLSASLLLLMVEALKEHSEETHGLETRKWVAAVKHEIDLAVRKGERNWQSCAKAFHHTPETIRKYFTSVAGYSPGSYFRKSTMNYAVELIHDSKLTIAEIAEKLGYCDQFHFSRQFKKALGKSPIQFRKSGRHAH